MLCPYCKEEIADGAVKCKHCQSMLGSPATQASPSAGLGGDISDAHARIDALPVSLGLKKKLHFVHDNLKGIQHGFPDYGKRGVVWSAFNWWAFLFTVIYYLIKGLWRKALIFLAINCLLVFILELLGAPDKVTMGVGVGMGVLAGMCAYPDIYRKEVLREVFWW